MRCHTAQRPAFARALAVKLQARTELCEKSGVNTRFFPYFTIAFCRTHTCSMPQWCVFSLLKKYPLAGLNCVRKSVEFWFGLSFFLSFKSVHFRWSYWSAAKMLIIRGIKRMRIFLLSKKNKNLSLTGYKGAIIPSLTLKVRNKNMT